MSRKKKNLIIFHLCFALSYFSWLMIQPYVKEVVAQKSELSLYEMLMERKAFFDALTSEEQEMLLRGFEIAKQKEHPSILHEIGRLFFVDTPAFALAWLFFSLVICLLLLFNIEGAHLATWLLPFLVLGYAYFLYSKPPLQRDSLFPREEYVLSTYVNENEAQGLDHRGKLLLGWHLYLINEWAHEEPSAEKEVFDQQLDKALFAFNVGRLRWILEGKGDEIVIAGFTSAPSLLRILCYFTWNLFFAWFINRQEKSVSSVVTSSQNSSA